MSFSFDALATLTAGFDSPRLRIAPVDADQAAAMLAWLLDPQVYTWISLKPPPDLATLQARLAAWGTRCSLDERELQLAWSVQRRSDGAWIGALDVNLSQSGVATNVGYFFGPPYWGQGLASEAVAALCAHLDAHGITEHHATVTVGNDASCRVLQRCGFRRIGLLPGNDTVRGELVDDWVFCRGGRQSG